MMHMRSRDPEMPGLRIDWRNMPRSAAYWAADFLLLPGCRLID
jgi:hypothetical protein